VESSDEGRPRPQEDRAFEAAIAKARELRVPIHVVLVKHGRRQPTEGERAEFRALAGRTKGILLEVSHPGELGTALYVAITAARAGPLVGQQLAQGTTGKHATGTDVREVVKALNP
jgi:hypothetical protein